MTQDNLLTRIIELIQVYANGKEAPFARLTGLSQSTLNRKIKSADPEQLIDLTGHILLAKPEISTRWLLFGEGEMLIQHPEDLQNDDRILDMEERIKELKYTIELQKQLLERRYAEDRKFPRSDVTPNTPAPGTQTHAPGSE